MHHTWTTTFWCENVPWFSNSDIDRMVWWGFNAVAGSTAYLTGLGIAAPVCQRWENSFPWEQARVTNERSSESARADDTTCIFAIFQPLVNSYSYRDPERLISSSLDSPGLDKGVWKESSWLRWHRFPQLKLLCFFLGTGQARSGGASAAQSLVKEKWQLSKNTGLDSAHSVKREQPHRWLQV